MPDQASRLATMLPMPPHPALKAAGRDGDLYSFIHVFVSACKFSTLGCRLRLCSKDRLLRKTRVPCGGGVLAALLGSCMLPQRAGCSGATGAKGPAQHDGSSVHAIPTMCGPSGKKW